MLAVAVLSLLAAALASLSINHIRLTGRAQHGRLAANAARSAVSLAVSQLLEQPEYGTVRLAGETLRYQGPGSLGVVTFHETTARDEGVRLSTNNLEGTHDIEGDGGDLVPSGTVEISAVGRSGGSERRIDVILRIPPFPWAIASAGGIQTQNGVLVAAIPEGVWPPPTDIEDLLPADLVANGNQTGAITLGDESLILGDLDTPGTVVLGQNRVDVRGEIRTGASPVDIPELHPTDYDPRVTRTTHFNISNGNLREIVGTARCATDVTFPDKLILTNGTLYVDGTLTLNNGVEGRGALIATGGIRIRARAQVAGLTDLAMLSGGRVQLSGSGAESSNLRGLFYAREGLEASELTLTGSLLTGTSSGGVELDNVNVLYQPPDNPSEEAGAFPSGSFYLGQYPTGQTAPSPTTTLFEPTSGPPGPGQSPLFMITLLPSNGGYPLTITISSPLSAVAAGPTVVANEAGLRAFLDEAERTLRSGLGGNIPSDSFYNIFQELSLHLLEYSSGQGSPQPSVVLTGDISRFLPIEDRVRVVSWVEQ